MIQFVYPLVFSLILINFVVTIILDAYVNLLPVFKTLAVHQDAITGTNLVCTPGGSRKCCLFSGKRWPAVCGR